MELDYNAMSLDELKQIQKGVTKAIATYEDRQRREAAAKLEQTARDLGVDPRTIFRYLEKEQNPMPSGAGGAPVDRGE